MSPSEITQPGSMKTMNEPSKRQCTDDRCLFFADPDTVENQFELVTTQTREGEGLWEKCNNCGLVINRSGVPEQEVEEFYNTEYIKNNSFSKGELVSAREHFDARMDSIKPVVEILKPHLTSSMRVFELGAGTGELLYLLKDKVNHCLANEINQLYTAFIRAELGIEASDEDYLTLEFEEKFDGIISLYTIDHMYDPLTVVEKIYSDLNPQGLLYLELPNDNQALKEYLPEPSRGKFKQFMYQKAHYYSFTFETLKKFLCQFGFEIIEEKSRHSYTLNNYLNWYYLGQPQNRFFNATCDTNIHDDSSKFGRKMNELFNESNEKFRQIMAECKVGESLCIVAKKVY